MHALFKKQKTPRAGTGRSNARNTLGVIKSIQGLYQETEKACRKEHLAIWHVLFDF